MHYLSTTSQKLELWENVFMQYMNNMCSIQAIPSPISGSTTTTFLVLFVRAARVPSAVGTPDKGSACAIRRPCGTLLGTPRNFCATRHRRESESEVDGAIPPIYKSYEEIQQPLQWRKVGINPIAAASACYTGRKIGPRSDMLMFHQILELTDEAEELNMTAGKFTHKCTTYIWSFVLLASAKAELIAGFITAGSIPRMATLWDMIKDRHVLYPILAAEDFTTLKLRDFIRKFKARSTSGDLRGISNSSPEDKTYFSSRTHGTKFFKC